MDSSKHGQDSRFSCNVFSFEWLQGLWHFTIFPMTWNFQKGFVSSRKGAEIDSWSCETSQKFDNPLEGVALFSRKRSISLFVNKQTHIRLENKVLIMGTIQFSMLQKRFHDCQFSQSGCP